MEDKEIILMEDLNCDLKKKPLPDHHTGKLLSLCSLYELTQVISEPTRVTESTCTLIDPILTNTPEHILSSGAIPTGISDDNLVYAICKFKPPKFKPTFKEVRDFKHFSETQFRNDLLQVPWVSILWCDDPNQCWTIWKSMFNEILNRHAPIRHKHVKSNPIPWITPAIKQLIRTRHYYKKKAIKFNLTIHWRKVSTFEEQSKHSASIILLPFQQFPTIKVSVRLPETLENFSINSIV